MALTTRDAAASGDATQLMFAPQLSGDCYAGEDLDPAAPCYIKQADGKIYMADGTAADEKAVLAGFTPKAYKAGQAVTLFGVGSRFRYGTGLTPGQKLFIGATKGRLDTAATTGDALGVAQVCPDGTDIRVIRNG